MKEDDIIAQIETDKVRCVCTQLSRRLLVAWWAPRTARPSVIVPQSFSVLRQQEPMRGASPRSPSHVKTCCSAAWLWCTVTTGPLCAGSFARAPALAHPVCEPDCSASPSPRRRPLCMPSLPSSNPKCPVILSARRPHALPPHPAATHTARLPLTSSIPTRPRAWSPRCW